MRKIFNKNTIWITIILVIGAASLGVTRSDFYRKIGKSQRLINEIYKQIFINYVDELDPESFTKASIRKITEELDPYTVYMVDEERNGIDLLAKGEYGGVGIQLGWRNKKLSVISPMDGGPAKAAGIFSGDIIISVDGKNVENMPLDKAASLIRGVKGSKVTLNILRYGVDDTLSFNLVRSSIHVKDVTFSGMLTPTTGYVRLNRFSRNSINEMKTALTDLMNTNAEEIIIDLRDNPGGLLNAAVSILDMLVPKGELLLTTKGRIRESNMSYYAQEKPLVPEDVKIVVLINQGSASASEIVSGTIQDLDRGLIIGQKSFGKGLVQRVYKIDKNRSIKITTAKYYIPSGRLIQKQDYINAKYVLNKTEEDTVFTTQGGRIVKAGGGITPDSTIELKEIPILTSEFWRRGFFFSFAQKHKHEYASLSALEGDLALLEKFKEFTSDQEIKIQLPGEKDLQILEEKITALDSTDAEVNSAILSLSKFYDRRKERLFNEEKDKLREWILIEFAGLMEGPEGRLQQILKNDLTVNTALVLIQDQIAYEISLSDKEHAKRF